MIGNVLYAGDGDGRVIPRTAVLRTDLVSGQSLRPLLLPPDPRFTVVSQSEEEPGALEGVDLWSGHVLSRGPWAGDVYALGETFTGPPMIIAESCRPAGLVAGRQAPAYHEAYCDSELLYAINA